MQPGDGRAIRRDGADLPADQPIIETAHTEPGEICGKVLFHCDRDTAIERAVTHWTDQYGRRRTAFARARQGCLINLGPSERLHHQHQGVPSL